MNQKKGQSVQTSVRITFEEAVFGVEKELNLTLKDTCKTCGGTGAKPGTRPTVCPTCQGKGQVVRTQQSMFGMVRNVSVCPDCHGTGQIIREKCPDCYGTGYVSSRKKIMVSIPAGIDNGQSIRLRGKGEPGINGGEQGDLLVQVIVARHPVFQRQDMDLYSTVGISFPIAALGGDIKVPTIDGDVIYTVKPGTQTDTRVRLRGKGVPSVRDKSTRGDHYVTLVVNVPTHLTADQQELLRSYDAAAGDSLHANTASADSTEGTTQSKSSGRRKKLFK